MNTFIFSVGVFTVMVALLVLSDEYLTHKETTKKRFFSPISEHIKVCYDNVLYLRGAKTLSVYIEPETLKPTNCDKEQK